MPRYNVRDSGGRFTSSNANVKVRLVLEGGRKVREELVTTGRFFSEQLGVKVAGTKVDRLRDSIKHLIGNLFDLRTVIATVGKALISGFAITAVFGAMFAAVNAVKALFVDVADFALKTVSQLTEMRLGLQALLATTGEFALDIKRNFELAGRAAGQLREELIALDPRTLGGLKELQVATQALLATGAQSMVGSTNAAEELAGVASLLVNTVVLLTGRVNDQRQIFSEIKELMLGNVRAQNQVAQLIASQVGDLDAWLDSARESGDLFEKMETVLGGINEAADEFLNVLTSIESSEENLVKLIAEAAYGQQADDILRSRRELLAYTEKNMEAIVAFKKETSGVAFIWQSIALKSRETWTYIQKIVGLAAMIGSESERIAELAQAERERIAAGGVVFNVPPQEGGGDTLGLTRSMVVLDNIRDGVKGLDSDIEKIHNDATKSAGDLMDDYSRGLFKLNNMLAEANKDVLKPLRDAAEEMRSMSAAAGQFALTVRLEAAKEVVRLANKIVAAEDSLKRLEENTLVALRKKREEARLKSANRIAAALSALNAINIAGLNRVLSIEQQVDNARQGALRTMRRHLSVLKELGYAADMRAETEKKAVTNINEQSAALEKYLRLESAKRVIEAETSLSRIDVAGLSKFLSIEEKVAEAVGDALEAMRKQLLVMEKESVSLEKRLQLEGQSLVMDEENVSLEKRSQLEAMRKQLLVMEKENVSLEKRLRLEAQLLVMEKENVSGDALEAMRKQLLVMEKENVSLEKRLQLEGDALEAMRKQLLVMEKENVSLEKRLQLEALLVMEEENVQSLEKRLQLEGGALEAMRKQLLVMEKANALLEKRSQLEAKYTAYIHKRGKALGAHLELERQERIDAAMVGIESIQIAGLNRVLSIEQQVDNARQGALRTLERFIDNLREQGVLAKDLLLIQLEGKAAIDGQTEALNKQHDLQESLAAGRHLIEQFRLQRQGVILPGSGTTGFKGLLEERQRRTQQLSGLRTDEDASPSDIREAETLVASLESELRNLLSTANSVASVIGGALTKAVLTVTEKGGTVMDFFKNLRANLKAVGEQMMFAFGQAFANAIQNLILGTGSMKEAIGGLIIAVGNLAIALGTVLILGSIFFGFGSIPIGLALIAAGAGMIALGALLGGSGPQGGALGAQPNATNQTPTFSFNQAQVNVQQGQAQSNADLAQATSSLADAHRSLESMPPGVVVKKGNTENGGLLTSVSRESGQGRQFVAQTNLAKNLRGI